MSSIMFYSEKLQVLSRRHLLLVIGPLEPVNVALIETDGRFFFKNYNIYRLFTRNETLNWESFGVISWWRFVKDSEPVGFMGVYW